MYFGYLLIQSGNTRPEPLGRLTGQLDLSGLMVDTLQAVVINNLCFLNVIFYLETKTWPHSHSKVFHYYYTDSACYIDLYGTLGTEVGKVAKTFTWVMSL